MIEITEQAQRKLGDYLKENSLDSAIRVYLSEGSCCGPSLALALDEVKDTDDKLETGGVTYIIDRGLSAEVGAVCVDFVEQGGRSGFMVSSDKPAAPKESGGCGGSCCC